MIDVGLGEAEMAQQLKLLAVLSEDLFFQLSAHRDAHNYLEHQL